LKLFFMLQLNQPPQIPSDGINSQVIVIVEKNPNTSTAITEKPNASMFLNLT